MILFFVVFRNIGRTVPIRRRGGVAIGPATPLRCSADGTTVVDQYDFGRSRTLVEMKFRTISWETGATFSSRDSRQNRST